MQDYRPHPLSESQFERLRLLLSTYQDGSGQNDQGLAPGWRDFERATAIALGGQSSEGKAFFDVLVPHPVLHAAYYGISCKMRGALTTISRSQQVTIEVSNAAGQFWDALRAAGLSTDNYTRAASAEAVGRIVVSVIESWKRRISLDSGGTVDLSRSSYLVLSFGRPTPETGRRPYQLHQFPPLLPETSSLDWRFPESARGQRRLVAYDGTGRTIIEWYGESGGQFKYYPHEDLSTWRSPIFYLEPLPPGDYGLQSKAATYFPQQWAACNSQ